MQSTIEIIATRTKVPVVRAGIGIFALPGTAIFSALLFEYGSESFHAVLAGVVPAIIGAVLGLLFFSAVAARIALEDGVLRILRALDEVVVPANLVIDTQVRVLRASHWVVGAIWLRARKLPIVFHFVVADTTNLGDLEATVAAVEGMFRSLKERYPGMRTLAEEDR